MTERSTCLLMTAGIFAATLAGSIFADIRSPHFLNRPLASIPQQVAGWMLMADRSLSVRVEKKLAASDYISRVYTKDGKQLDLFVAYYADQRTGEGMHSPKHCLPGAGWEIWKRDSTDIQPHGRRVTINCYSIQRALRRAAVLYWYQDRYRIVASEYTAKFMLLKDGLLSGDASGALVRIVVDDDLPSRGAAAAFASELVSELEHCYGGVAPAK